jgi:hypothetical protein
MSVWSQSRNPATDHERGEGALLGATPALLSVQVADELEVRSHTLWRALSLEKTK